jgi:uncharacterized Fe-S cluster protein YjdI
LFLLECPFCRSLLLVVLQALAWQWIGGATGGQALAWQWILELQRPQRAVANARSPAITNRLMQFRVPVVDLSPLSLSCMHLCKNCVRHCFIPEFERLHTSTSQSDQTNSRTKWDCSQSARARCDHVAQCSREQDSCSHQFELVSVPLIHPDPHESHKIAQLHGLR